MNKSIYAIAGPTASGKTSLSICIAKNINAEIISVDSSLVYKGMDIGTAKPTLREQADVKHHLIDIIEPTKNFSVADFISSVNKLKKEIWSRNKEVLLVGGTMLYFKGLIEGLSSLPESRSEIRQTLELEKKAKGLQSLHEQLKRMDSESAQKINSNDQQRIFRALEVIIISGQKYSKLVRTPKVGGLEEELKLCALVPKDRSILHKNIELRFKQMLDQGFINEVRELRKNLNLTKNTTAIRSVGYRQAWEYLDGDIGYDEFIKKGIVSTRQLAKRQLTWIRNWQGEIKTIEMEDDDKELKVLDFFSA
ncbi:tRNA dimethylallyltransferase [Francisella halioticida]|uniref:tRNA dimethylallyltransferase n=1 Tax=Francisella halioticida TaxID=549298 RepID=A0ABN5B153_9GAMM|nr:tRNA (adenosine(37)-N6)-dimethylallyltransferase MiaA [Francisella halioticida]ASG68197.1 tRNA (adenosine(37)-N6)-dimethylallyltransferase MiaA [Francisella halioticida]BCD90992.1 tRNA dimethylallyltransferase [Francisella halioticida]